MTLAWKYRILLLLVLNLIHGPCEIRLLIIAPEQVGGVGTKLNTQSILFSLAASGCITTPVRTLSSLYSVSILCTMSQSMSMSTAVRSPPPSMLEIAGVLSDVHLSCSL